MKPLMAIHILLYRQQCRDCLRFLSLCSFNLQTIVSDTLTRREGTTLRLYLNRLGLTQPQQLERKQRLREIGSKVFNIFFDNPEKYGFEIREGQQEMACE